MILGHDHHGDRVTRHPHCYIKRPLNATDIDVIIIIQAYIMRITRVYKEVPKSQWDRKLDFGMISDNPKSSFREIFHSGVNHKIQPEY